ncbi:IS4 family transposase, partial [bacterium]|nr:IS4 family transposase [bacterium]
MTKQPVLTGFPHTVFATAKRRAQATIQSMRRRITQGSLCGYALIFEDVLPTSFLSSIDPTKRQRHFGHIPVFWAWLTQILEANASCTKAVSMIQAWCRVLKLPVPACCTSPYCQGRIRMKEDFLIQIDRQVQGTLQRHISPIDCWRGLQLKAIDGTSVTLLDTQKKQDLYPQHSSQKEGCGHPLMGMVGITNLSHGGIEGFETCPARKHDSVIAPRLLKHVHPDDLLLGDRAFCSYEFIARILSERNGHVLMRLHQARHRKLDWRKGKKISPIERLVTWVKPHQQPAGSELSPEQWEHLPSELTLRYIKLGYENRAGEKAALVVVTDLLDPGKHPADELADLYMERWRIELTFRDLKTTLGMEYFAVKTPEMAHKTLLMMTIAYNLLRVVMQRSAQEAGKSVSAMSVKGSLDCLTSSHESFRSVVGKPRLRRKLTAQFIEDCSGHVLPERPYRQEPRA